MASRIEQIIEEIEEYIDGCKPQTFSSSKIIVNREEMEELLNELRVKTPEEIKRYQKIISNKEAILADAQAKADAIIAQAQEILDNATNDANNIRMGAMQYTDDILRNLENTISHSMDAAKARHDAYVSSLQGFLDVVTANRAELNPTAEEPESKTTDAQASQADGPKVEISSDMLG